MKSAWPILIIICALAVYHMFDVGHWSSESSIRSDGYGYYGYIEGALVHGDPLNEKRFDENGRLLYRSWMQEGLPGKHLPKWTMGVAYAWVPGFIIADAYACAFDHEQHGWSTPYQLAVAFTAILFLLLGTWATWQVLIKRYSWWIATITVFLVFYATNLLHYSTSDSGMSHVYNFGLIALYLWLNDRWLSNYKTRDLLLMSVLLGWIVLIRPTNITIGLATLIMLYAQTGSLRKLFSPQLALAALVAFLPIVPQLVFWKFTTGHWVTYSYENEAFYWFTGNFINGLFSYRNGWLLYTPIMIFALVGIALTRKVDKGLFWASSVIMLLHIYITFSWWCWYYGGSLSIRPMIDMFALCAFGLAGLFNYVFARSRIVSALVIGLMSLLVWNNLLQTNYFKTGAITDSTMTKKAFWAFFMNSKGPGDLALIGDGYRDADTDRLRQGLPERTKFDTTLISVVGKKYFDPYSKQGALHRDNIYSGKIKVSADSLTTHGNQVIKVTFTTYCEDYKKAKLQGVIDFKKEGGKQQDYRATEIIHTEPISGKRNRSSFYLTKKREVEEGASMIAYMWLQGKEKVILESIEVELIEVNYAEDQ